MKQFLAAKSLKTLAGAMLFIVFAGCSVFDPAEEIPSYLHIDAMTVLASSTQGTSASSKISDAWVYMDGQLLGAYEMPCTLPILAEGTHHFLIKAGVKMNGSGATRSIYPFYKGYENDLTLTRGQVTRVMPDPVVPYFPATDFTWNGNFEAGNPITTEATSTPTMVVGSNSAEAFENAYGFVQLNSSATFWVGRSNLSYPLNATGEVWLELNYRCNEDFTVGIVGSANDYHPWVVVAPNATWNKLYIRLTDVIATTLSTSPYHIYFAMNRTSVDQPYLYLDNIKLVK